MNGYGEGLRGQIIEVWAHNLEEELERIRDVVERYPYIALDTEFPGIVARPTSNALDYNYRTVKYNVDLLKVIQLGLTFADSRGCLAEGTCTWQFNFRFDLNEDMYAQNSIDFLKQSGIDFDKQQKKGVEVHNFGELVMNSGLVMNEDVKWISFHGCYDFGYLLKLLTCEALPESEQAFFELVQDFFPSLYDIKFLLRDLPTFNLSQGSSLQKVSEQLNVQRVGPQHQAGSDSLVTCRTFFSLMESYFDGKIDEAKFSGVIYGLGSTAHKPHRCLLSGSSLSSHPSQEGGILHHCGLGEPSKLQIDNIHQAGGASEADALIVSAAPPHASGAATRYMSSGPTVRVPPIHTSPASHHIWGPMAVGRISSGLIQQQSIPLSAAGANIQGLGTSNSDVVNSEAIGRNRGLPHPNPASGVSGTTRTFGTDLHRTGSAPPTTHLCNNYNEIRTWPGSGGAMGSIPSAADTTQQMQGEGRGFVYEGAGGAPLTAGGPRRT